jgi:drug/metabolite transporter (DMT)-like permease
MLPERKFSEKLLLAAIVASMLLWGLSWPSNKILTNYLDPVNFIVCRYIIVVLTLFPILLFLKVPVTGSRNGIPYILFSGLLLAFYSYLFAIGLKAGFAGAGGVLVTTLNPIMAYTIGIIINRKKPSRIEFYGLLMGLIAGSILLNVWDEGGTLFDTGNLFFLAAAFVWAVMSVFTSKAKKFGTSFSFSFWQYIITLLCMVPLINYSSMVSVLSITDSIFWMNMFFSSAIVTSLATTVYFYATTKVGPEKASSFIFLVPLGAETSAWIFLNEPVLIHTVVGGVLGILAVYLLNRKI